MAVAATGRFLVWSSYRRGRGYLLYANNGAHTYRLRVPASSSPFDDASAGAGPGGHPTFVYSQQAKRTRQQISRGVAASSSIYALTLPAGRPRLVTATAATGFAAVAPSISGNVIAFARESTRDENAPPQILLCPLRGGARCRRVKGGPRDPDPIPGVRTTEVEATALDAGRVAFAWAYGSELRTVELRLDWPGARRQVIESDLDPDLLISPSFAGGALLYARLVPNPPGDGPLLGTLVRYDLATGISSTVPGPQGFLDGFATANDGLAVSAGAAAPGEPCVDPATYLPTECTIQRGVVPSDFTTTPAAKGSAR
jgi:hypothetical protein